MTIQTALDRLDEMKPNKMERELKVSWLSEIDGLIHREIVLTHEHPEEWNTFDGYDMSTDPATELIAPFPYDELYRHWLASKVDEQNAEYGKYNADRTLFNSAYQALQDWWTKQHLPITRLKHFKF